ncbi:hypothetical protein [Kibdelosporangium philippinense]|uniref:hypothetical protein n=1 Tax=Kibdelosporangium philippinense TaxID=211113 RepID=UPI0036130B21
MLAVGQAEFGGDPAEPEPRPGAEGSTPDPTRAPNFLREPWADASVAESRSGWPG